MNVFNLFEDSYDRREVFKTRVEKIGEEKDLNGDDIKKIVREHCEKKGVLVTHERNHVASNDHPFDVIIGEPKDLLLIGGEIKGDTDDYHRLPNQLQAYSFVFDNIYLIIHKKKIPEWLPEYVGVLRVFENGDVLSEKFGYARDLFDVGSIYDNDVLLELNGVALKSQEAKKKLAVLSSVRKNFLFNRFFSVSAGYNTRQMTKWWPLSDDQKEVLIGFDIARQQKNIEDDIRKIEKKIEMLKRVVSIGVSKLEDFEARK